MKKINRRQLGQRIAAASLISTLPPASSEAGLPPTSNPTLSSDWHPVTPGIWRAILGTPEPFSPVKSRLIEKKPLTSLSDLPARTVPPLAAVQAKVTPNGGLLITMPLEPNAEIYGLGLQFMSFAQRGKKKTMRVNADPRADSGDTHAPVPFFVSTSGYGVLVDTARYAEFYFGDAQPRPSSAHTQAEGTSSAQADPYRIEGGHEIFIHVPRSAGVDLYLFTGATMLDAVRFYNLFSGGGVMPPEWGLGFWYRTYKPAPQQEVVALAKEFRDRNIPCDVIGLEPGWHSHAYPCTFTWDPKLFPDPAGFMTDLRKMDFRLNLWEHAFTSPASPLFAPLQSCSGDMATFGGLVPDFAGEEARQVFGEYHGRELIDAGISGFKLDECDNSDFTGGWSFPEFSQFPSGVDGEQMHSVFGLLYQRTIWEQYRKRRQETYGLVRCSGALAAPYPFVLYSDLYDHRQFIRALVNSGFSGLLWCPEVRDASSTEDFIRRLQSVVFSPLAMVNGWYIRNPPWKQIDRQKNIENVFIEDWERLEQKCREIIGWRMRLIPYLRRAFLKYAFDGTPPFRALVLDWPQDEMLRNVDDEYMIGDRMLVAPLFAGENERKVTLPEGAWQDFGREARLKAVESSPSRQHRKYSGLC